jgi:hypothetical protein
MESLGCGVWKPGCLKPGGSCQVGCRGPMTANRRTSRVQRLGHHDSFARDANIMTTPNFCVECTLVFS